MVQAPSHFGVQRQRPHVEYDTVTLVVGASFTAKLIHSESRVGSRD